VRYLGRAHNSSKVSSILAPATEFVTNAVLGVHHYIGSNPISPAWRNRPAVMGVAVKGYYDPGATPLSATISRLELNS
jgi:hypothetical protein